MIREGVVVPRAALHVAAVRSGGPGGQNVNKVSSKVELRVELDAIVGLSDAQRARVRERALPLLDARGRLLVKSELTRDQARNLEDACAKVRALVLAALPAPKRRVATRPSRGARERRLESKRADASKKRDRRWRGD